MRVFCTRKRLGICSFDSLWRVFALRVFFERTFEEVCSKLIGKLILIQRNLNSMK